MCSQNLNFEYNFTENENIEFFSVAHKDDTNLIKKKHNDAKI